MYKRKTKSIWCLITDYGYGEEYEVGYDSYKEAKQGKKEYLENASNLKSIKIKEKRERIEK